MKSPGSVTSDQSSVISGRQVALPLELPHGRPVPKPADQLVSLTWFARIRQVVEAAHEIQPYEHKFGKAGS